MAEIDITQTEADALIAMENTAPMIKTAYSRKVEAGWQLR